MKTAVIVHGSLGNPENHWYQWLKQELEGLGFEVFVPQFPTGEGEQTVANWLKVLEPVREKLRGGIMVGHSLGAPFIINVLNEWDIKLKSAFFVGGFIGEHSAEGITFEDFTERDFNWEKVRTSGDHFVVLNADNDPYVPIEKGELLAKNVGVELTIVPGAGHFQSQSGYSNLPSPPPKNQSNSRVRLSLTPKGVYEYTTYM